MDPTETRINPNPKETANVFSRMFFWWAAKLFWKGRQKDLDLPDLYGPVKGDESEKLGDLLEQCWQKELDQQKLFEFTADKDGEKKARTGNKEPRFYRALLRAFWLPFFSIGLIECLQASGLRVAQPILQGYILTYFNVKLNERQTTKGEVLIYAGSLSLVLFAMVFVLHHSNQFSHQLGMRMRIACSSLIYRKTLRLSQKALKETTAGQVVNLLSNDISRFDELPGYLHYVWITPLQVIIVTNLMWQKVGYSCIVGVGSILLLTLSFNSIFTVISRTSRAKIAAITDRRVQLMNELIAGIQVIKMYAWEMPFATIVAKTRATEMREIKWASLVRAVHLSVIVFTERTVLYLTIITFVLAGNHLTADVSYVLTIFFNILQLSAAIYLPNALILCGEIAVSAKRIEHFLLLDEFSKNEISDQEYPARNGTLNQKIQKKIEEQGLYRLEKLTTETSDGKTTSNSISIELQRVYANWIHTQLPPTLCNLTAKIKGGELCALIGTVGSGKTSMLNLILKELPVAAGSLGFFHTPSETIVDYTKGYFTNIKNLRISYASQEAWLFSATVKENILFGQPYDAERYRDVTRVCALTTDFRQLPHGDSTIIGEGGSSLSGGQRARVNLARAVYKKADIYLLDDPLSAVDSRVSKHLFNKCIKGYLNGKTRILVTHQLQFVDRADTIIVLDRGSVKMKGSYTELISTDNEFTQMMNRIKVSNEANKKCEPETVVKEQPVSRRRTSSIRRMSVKSVGTASVVSCDEDIEWIADIANEEEVAKGCLSLRVYNKYFREGCSRFGLIFTIIFFIISQVTISGTDYWLSYWTNLEIVRKSINAGAQEPYVQFSYMFNNSFLSSIFPLDSHGLITTNSAIYMHTFLIVACIAVCLIRSFLFMAICVNASRNLHNKMFANILQTTMRFFNDNSSGRILNRFSKDVGSMDENLPKVMLESIQITLLMTAILFMVVIVNYWMIVPLIILGTAFYFVGRLYVRIAQSIKRLEGVAKSPVFAHANTTLNGLTTIRSAGQETQMLLRQKFDRLQDVHSGASYLTVTTTSAFGLLLDILACLFIASVCFSFILFDAGTILGGNVGLAISQSLIIVGTLQYGIRQSAQMLSFMTAVERLFEYTDLPKEGSFTSNNPPPATWPSTGRLILKDVSLKYKKDDDPVLKNINATIESGWKVGVVGRTGAGKSSLISVLFRLYPEGTEGEIKIDGRDTSTLGFHELRSRISIIPQDPVIFSESLRYNLDPFNDHNDMTLWEVLREVKLIDATLDQKVMQSGSNFSVGQRQLICLARAMLRNNRILVLDEATANIDSDTDAFIQRTIREKFTNCSVITIAHRLNTIIDSDRIIVMEAGRIVEFGCPHELLQSSPNGFFAQMVNKTGSDMARNLREQAEKACIHNNNQHSLDLRRESLTDGNVMGDIIEQYAF